MFNALPEHLAERCQLINVQIDDFGSNLSEEADGDFILYWMRSAVRTEENPALDVAIWLAEHLSKPLLVYHGLSHDYDFASDRHHTFIMQGARDVQAEFKKRGISYAFHLETPDDNRPHLVELADRAAIVITEDMPVDPPRRFLNALTRKTETPIACVDTACVVPMQLVKKPFTRAFQYRNATKKLYSQRISRPWPEVKFLPKPFDLKTLDFAPIDFQQSTIPDLVARCDIDHAIGPVVDTVGGSTTGNQRWNAFKENGLSKYARTRNNALLDGVSRMSAYLHYGMVSPFRLAREAAAYDHSGAEKYLDELLIWRELAYSFCFHRDDHDQWSSIPDWAQDTLNEHAGDTRENLYSWEQLARGETNDPLWNAAQKSLLMQGELHNNLRMTWGKAILNWTKTPQQALATIIDLNHRYALDGRDPASYGGILWCLGQFDRPFEPERSIVGTVRPRPTKQHSQRLDPNSFMEKVTTPRFEPVPHVAIIGAGISGLFAARTLIDHGLNVTVFEKSRGVGGRMASRRTEHETSFDHGAQYFTARNKNFKRYVDAWIQQGIVEKWSSTDESNQNRIVVLKNGNIESESQSVDRYVAVPYMNSICKHLASNIDISRQTRVHQVVSSNDGLELIDESANSLGIYDRVIVSAPAGQASEILVDFPNLANPISKISMKRCWAAMIAFENKLTDQWVGAFVHDSFLSWAARNNTKPQRNQSIEHLVLHADHDWTNQRWENDPIETAQQMLDEFWRVSGIAPQQPTQISGHRWGFALANEPSTNGCFFDAQHGIAACGDWANGSRVEGAFLSGMAAAGRILGTLSPKSTGKQNEQLELF